MATAKKTVPAKKAPVKKKAPLQHQAPAAVKVKPATIDSLAAAAVDHIVELQQHPVFKKTPVQVMAAAARDTIKLQARLGMVPTNMSQQQLHGHLGALLNIKDGK